MKLFRTPTYYVVKYKSIPHRGFTGESSFGSWFGAEYRDLHLHKDKGFSNFIVTKTYAHALRQFKRLPHHGDVWAVRCERKRVGRKLPGTWVQTEVAVNE